MATRSFNMIRAFLVSVVGTGLSRVMGAVRDIVLSHVLGAGKVSDAFWIAFTVPGIFRRFVADEGLTGSLVPAVARAEKDESVEEARALAGRTLVALLVAGLLLATLGVVFAPWLVKALALGFTRDSEQFALAVRLTRIMFPFIIFVSIVSWCEGLLNHRGHFFIPKIAPGFVSASIVVAALLGASSAEPVLAVAWGTIVGGAVHLAVCIPPLKRHWGWIRPRFSGFIDPRFSAFAREMGKVVAIGILAQVNIMVLRQLASLLEPGSVTHYWYANRVVDLAQGAIAVGVGSALLPAISRDAAAEDWETFQQHFSQAIRLAGLVLLPAALLTAVTARPVISVLFLHGRFTPEDAASTAATLRMMVPFMLAVAGINIVKRAYFALDRRNTLMLVGGVGIVVTGSLGYAFSGRLGVQGLALGLSISTTFQLVAYLFGLARVVPRQLELGALLGPLARILEASIPAAMAAWAICLYADWNDGPTLRNIVTLAVAGNVAMGTYALLARALGVKELEMLTDKLRAKLGGRG